MSILRRTLSVFGALCLVSTNAVQAKPSDILRDKDSREIAIISEAVSPTQFTTGVLETTNFEELHSRNYLYYLNDYFEQDGKSLRVSIWLKGFNFGANQTKREKAVRLCSFMARPEVDKQYQGSFDEEQFGGQFALAFFKDLCDSPLKQVEAFEDCQARLSRSYLRWNQGIRPGCHREYDLEKSIAS